MYKQTAEDGPERLSWLERGPARDALRGRVAVVTGAGRGIGRAIAQGYARAGAQVVCVSRTPADVAGLAADIETYGGRALARTTDVASLPAVEAMMSEAVAAFGGLDILVLSHGVALGLGPVENSDPEGWRTTLEVNLLGAYYCARAAIPHLKARGAGKMILVGSGQGHRPTASTAAYASAKAGLWALAQSLAAELVSSNISVNELLPGNVDTGLYQDTFSQVDHQTLQGVTSLAGQRSHEWLKSPEDVVPLALFMACQPDVGPTAQSFSLMRRF